MPLFVLVVSLLLTAAASALVALMSREREAARFEHVVEGAKDRIATRLDAYVALLRSGAAFVSAAEAVAFHEFERFVARNRLPELYPGIQGFGYSAYVPDEIRDSVIAGQRASHFPDFRLWPEVPPGEEVHSIVFLLPLDLRNRAAIGFNMYSEATRREAMARARDSGRVSMSGRVTLVQEIDGRPQAGFLIYSPVYAEGQIPETAEQRRATLLGFVYAPFRGDDLFAGIFGSEADPHVAFRVYDGRGTGAERLLHDSRTQGITPSESPRFVATDTLRIAGHPWTIEFATTEAFDAQPRDQRVWLMMLLLGAAASLVIFLVARRQAAARVEAEALALRVHEATRELEGQVEEVQQLNRSIEGANEELAKANRALRASNQQLLALRLEADEAREEADRANRVKSEFLAAMSHELRTPLNAITGYAELLQMGIHGPVNEKQQQALERIRRSQTHLLGLINDILNYAKLEAGKVEIERKAVPLADVLSDLRTMTEPQAREKGLTLSFDEVPESLAAFGDEEKMRQILLNLLTNAIKFTPSGGKIHLDHAIEDERIRIRVSDTGSGIAADQLQGIFDPFIQVDRSGGRDGQHGVGLGLAISRDLARLMDGELTAESELGRGSAFTLELPRAPTVPSGRASDGEWRGDEPEG